MSHVPLMCVGCGCTDTVACPEGCSWLSKDPAHPVCSRCPEFLAREIEVPFPRKRPRSVVRIENGIAVEQLR